MDMRKKLSKEEKARVVELGKEGKTYTEIAALMDGKITRQRAKQICAEQRVDAASIRRKVNENNHTTKMVAKWGPQWANKEHRKHYVYQAMRSKFRTKKANTKKAGKQWTVDFGDLEFPTHCPVLGIELNYFNEVICDNSPSFDCVIPERGYVKGNVCIISQRANRIKNDGTAQEHYAIAQFIEAYAKTPA